MSEWLIQTSPAPFRLYWVTGANIIRHINTVTGKEGLRGILLTSNPTIYDKINQFPVLYNIIRDFKSGFYKTLY